MAPSRLAGPGDTSTQAELGEGTGGWVAFADELSHAAGAANNTPTTIGTARANNSRRAERSGTSREEYSGDLISMATTLGRTA
jgi:hypothetical protein